MSRPPINVEDPAARRARLAQHKKQYQAADLKAAREVTAQKRREAQDRRYELELEEAENQAFQLEQIWLGALDLPSNVMEMFAEGEMTVSDFKQMGRSDFVNLGLPVAKANEVYRTIKIEAGEPVEDEEEEKGEEKKEEIRELTPEEEEAKRVADEEAAKVAAEAAEEAKRQEALAAVQEREEKQKIREAKQAERKEANRKRQLKMAEEKKKKEEARIAKLKAKNEAAKLEARRREEEQYEAERVANRAKMEAFLAEEEKKRELLLSPPSIANSNALEEKHQAVAEEEEPQTPPPVFSSSGRLLTQLSATAFVDQGGELRISLLGLSTSCATVYGKRAAVARRELTWLLKQVIKVYGENVIVSTPLADELELLGAEIVLSLGLQLRALLPPIKEGGGGGGGQEAVISSSSSSNVDVGMGEQTRSFDLGAAVSSAIGPDLADIDPEFHASILQRRVRLTELLSKEGVSVFHVPALEWGVHGYHCVRGILAENSDLMLAVVDAVPTPTPPGLLWDTVRLSLLKGTAMVVVKSHERMADLHGFRNTDTLGRALLSRYSVMPCI